MVTRCKAVKVWKMYGKKISPVTSWLYFIIISRSCKCNSLGIFTSCNESAGKYTVAKKSIIAFHKTATVVHYSPRPPFSLFLQFLIQALVEHPDTVILFLVR